MYMAVINDTQHRPKELKALVWNQETDKIIAYCKTMEQAWQWADRLNGKDVPPVQPEPELPEMFQGLM